MSDCCGVSKSVFLMMKKHEKDDGPCISGARSAKENEPIRMAKKTLMTVPASAEKEVSFNLSAGSFDDVTSTVVNERGTIVEGYKIMRLREKATLPE